MRRIVIFSWLMATFCLSQTVRGQFNFDQSDKSTLVVDLGEGNQLLLEETEFTLKEHIDKVEELNKMVTNINATLRKLPQKLNPYLAYKIIYTIREDGTPSLQVKKKQKEIAYQTEEGQQGQPLKLHPDTVVIQYPSFALILELRELAVLDDLEVRPLNGYLNALKRDFADLPKRYHKNHVEMEYTAKENNLERTKSRLIHLDYISFFGGGGISLIGSDLATNVSISGGITLKNRLYLGVKYDFLYFFGSERRVRHDFIGGEIGFRANFNDWNTRWWKFGFDILLNDTNTLEDLGEKKDDVFRFSLDLPLSKTGLFIAPQLYMIGGDRFIGGLKLGIGF